MGCPSGIEAFGVPSWGGSRSGDCFCVAVVVYEHEDPLTRTASKWLRLHLLQTLSPITGPGADSKWLFQGLGVWVRCPYSSTCWAPKALPKGHARSLLVESNQQWVTASVGAGAEGIRHFPLWPGNANARPSVHPPWSLQLWRLNLESALPFWWLCLSASVCELTLLPCTWVGVGG